MRRAFGSYDRRELRAALGSSGWLGAVRPHATRVRREPERAGDRGQAILQHGAKSAWKNAASPAVKRVGARSPAHRAREGGARRPPPQLEGGMQRKTISVEERSLAEKGGHESRRGLAAGARGAQSAARARRGVRRRRARGDKRGRPSSITSASSAILALPRPEALRPGIAPGVLFSVIVDRCGKHHHRSKKQAIFFLDGSNP
jgi:hypothetical protein